MNANISVFVICVEVLKRSYISYYISVLKCNFVTLSNHIGYDHR